MFRFFNSKKKAAYCYCSLNKNIMQDGLKTSILNDKARQALSILMMNNFNNFNNANLTYKRNII